MIGLAVSLTIQLLVLTVQLAVWAVRILLGLTLAAIAAVGRAFESR